MYDADYEEWVQEQNDREVGEYLRKNLGNKTPEQYEQIVGNGQELEDDWDSSDSSLGLRGDPIKPENLAKFKVKDSGEKAKYDDGMQRDTSAGKPQFALLFPKDVPYEDQLMTRVAALYHSGAKKYSPSIEIGTEELVDWCSCGLQTVILTGLTTLGVCAETAMSAISEAATQNLSNASAVIQPNGLSATENENAQQTWLIASEALNASPSKTDTSAGPVSDWLLKTASDYLLTQLVSARSATMTLAQVRTWITTTAQDSHEDFYAHAVTRAWDSWEIRQKLFGEHSPTCSTHRLQATSGGIRSLEGRNWEKSSTEESLAHHEEALMRHVVRFLLGVDDGEDHGAAVVWNVNAVDLTRRKIRENKEVHEQAFDGEFEDGVTTVAALPFNPNPELIGHIGEAQCKPVHVRELYFNTGDAVMDADFLRWVFRTKLGDGSHWNSHWNLASHSGTFMGSAEELAKQCGPLTVCTGANAGVTILKDGSLKWA